MIDSLYQQFRSYKQGIKFYPYYEFFDHDESTSLLPNVYSTPVPDEYDLLLKNMSFQITDGGVAVIYQAKIEASGILGNDHRIIVDRLPQEIGRAHV